MNKTQFENIGKKKNIIFALNVYKTMDTMSLEESVYTLLPFFDAFNDTSS